MDDDFSKKRNKSGAYGSGASMQSLQIHIMALCDKQPNINRCSLSQKNLRSQRRGVAIGLEDNKHRRYFAKHIILLFTEESCHL